LPRTSLTIKRRRAFGIFLSLIFLTNLAPASALSSGRVRAAESFGARTSTARPSNAGAARAQAESHNIRSFFLATNDLVVDPLTQTIYASVPSAAGAGGNSVTPINPSDGTIGTPVFVGSEPGQMAVSDNGQYIYVSLDGAAAVRRYDVAAHTAGLQFPVGDGGFAGTLFANDLEVMPGNAETIAVSRRDRNFNFQGVALYDNGVQRTRVVRTQANYDDFIEFSSSPNTIYGYGFLGGALEKMTVDASGLTVAKSTQISGSALDFKYENGLIYLQSGQVYNAESGTLLGTFPLNLSSDSLYRVVPDASVGRAYFITGPSSNGGPRTVTIRAFDQQTFLPTGTLDVAGVFGDVTSFVRWGANGLAFRTSGNQVFLIQTSLIPSSTPVPTQSPTPTPTATPTPTPTPTPEPGEFAQVSITAKDIILDPASQLLYASVPGSVGAGGNSITPIDPSSGAVGQSVFVGSEPGKMAISDDSHYIYVGLDGANAVNRYDVQAKTVGAQFPLGADQFGGPFRLKDIAVAPGNPNTVAIARTSNFTSSGIGIYDNGVARSIGTGTFNTSDLVEYSGSPNVIYGLNNSDTEGGFRRLGAGPCGALVLSNKWNLLGGFNNDFKFDNGRVYGSSGWVADPEAGTPVGRYRFADGPFGNGDRIAVAVDSGARRVYFLSGQFTIDNIPLTIRLTAFDQRTFIKVGSLDIPNVIGGPTALVRWGANGLAFRTDKDRVYLLHNSLVATPASTVTPAPTPAPPTRTLTGNVYVSNVGGIAGVTLTLSGSATGTTVSDSNGNFSFGGLPLCGDYTITPSKEMYAFDPQSRTITAANNNNPNQSTAFFNAIPNAVGFFLYEQPISEGAGSVRATVYRTGDTSGAATVFYQTNDGTASERADYNAALGTLHFAPNEFSKQLTVFITDDARAESAETFTLSLSNPTGALLGTFSTLAVTVNDNDASNGANPADDSTFFVRQHYRDFLNRDPDAPGLAFWTNEIESCGTNTQCREVKRINVSAAFFLSIEFQETGYLVERTYKTAYGDTTSPGVSGTVPVIHLSEFLPDTQSIGQGLIVGQGNWQAQLEANKVAYFADFVSRPGFVSSAPTTLSPAQFIDTLFSNAGVTPTTAQRQAAIDEFAGAGNTADLAARGRALRRVAENPTLQQRELNRAFVLMEYYGYLRRNPNDAPEPTLNFAGWKFWLDKLNLFGGNFVQAEMVKAFISSDEYRHRFGQ
jgi:hypothetical protein